MGFILGLVMIFGILLLCISFCGPFIGAIIFLLVMTTMGCMNSTGGGDGRHYH